MRPDRRVSLAPYPAEPSGAVPRPLCPRGALLLPLLCPYVVRPPLSPLSDPRSPPGLWGVLLLHTSRWEGSWRLQRQPMWHLSGNVPKR